MEITIKNLQNKLPINNKKIEKLIRKILKSEKAKPDWINICFTGNPLIGKLNKKFLKTTGPTDVLAFNLGSRKNILADIVISTDTAIKQAKAFKTTPQKELMLYVAHGILHILGFDDHTKSQINLMRKKESKYVN